MYITFFLSNQSCKASSAKPSLAQASDGECIHPQRKAGRASRATGIQAQRDCLSLEGSSLRNCMYIHIIREGNAGGFASDDGRVNQSRRGGGLQLPTRTPRRSSAHAPV